jgi:hypothetical protein
MSGSEQGKLALGVYEIGFGPETWPLDEIATEISNSHSANE